MTDGKKTPQQRGGEMSRRHFLATTAAAAAAFTIVPRHVLGGRGYTLPSENINLAIIGVGGQGTHDMQQLMTREGTRVVAVADPVRRADYSKFYFGGFKGRDPAKELVEDYYANQAKSGSYKGCATYEDYREMLVQEKDIDAVVVATTDNVHAVATMAAIKAGKHVYTEKPLTHDIYEARAIAEAARKAGVMTQMGNQGHAGEGNRLLVEWIADGAIGEVYEAHCWTNRPMDNWPQGIDRPTGRHWVPRGMDWDLWLGPAPYRPYHSLYTPFNWRGWWDFGTGAMGDMGCHILDTPVWALNLGHPTSVQASSTPYNDETFPLASFVTYDFPARGKMPPVKLYWYDGGLMPPRPDELEEGRRMPQSGTILVGTEGKIMCADYSDEARLIPEAAMKAYNRPPKTIPRSPGIHQGWLDAIRSGKPASSNFNVSGPLTEVVLLANLAIRAGRNVKLMWDGPNMKVTNVAEVNQYVRREYREGWSL